MKEDNRVREGYCKNSSKTKSSMQVFLFSQVDDTMRYTNKMTTPSSSYYMIDLAVEDDIERTM